MSEEQEVYILDTFTDDDGTLLEDHAPDIGGAWERLSWGDGGGTHPVILVNGRAMSEGTGTSWEQVSRVYRNATEPGEADYEITGVWQLGASALYAFIARMMPGEQPWEVDRYRAWFYEVDLDHVLRGYRLDKVTDDTVTLLAAFHVDETNQQRDVKFEVADHIKKLWIDGSEVLSSADNEIPGPGRVGLVCGGSDGGNAWMDDFQVAELAEPPEPPDESPESPEEPASPAADARAALVAALRTVPGIRVYSDPTGAVDPPAAIVSLPDLHWENYAAEPTRAVFEIALVVKANDRAIDALAGLVLSVHEALESVDGVTAEAARVGTWADTLPAYLIETEVSL